MADSTQPLTQPVPRGAEEPTPAILTLEHPLGSTTKRTTSVLELFLPNKWLLLLCAILSSASAMATTGLVMVISRAVASSSFPTIPFILLTVVAMASAFVAQTFSHSLVERMGARAKLVLTRRILQLPLRTIDRVGPSRLLTVLTADVPTIVHGLGPAIILVVSNVVMVVACVAYLLWLSWRAALWVLPVMVVAAALYAAVDATKKQLKRMRSLNDTLMKHYRASIDGAKELKLRRRARESIVERGVQETADELRRESTSVGKIWAAADIVVRMIFFVAVGLVLAFGLGTDVPRPVVIGYVITILYLVSPMRLIVAEIKQLFGVRDALRNITSLGLLDEEVEKTNGVDVLSQPEEACELLSLRDVSFKYLEKQEGSGFKLGPIDLTLRRGELVLVVGGNGSGKSTLLKLLTGLYVPDAGEIVFNGHTIGPANLDWYRQHFSAVFFDFFLIDEFGKESGVDDRVRSSLASMRLSHKVKIDGGRFSTVNLSQGQRRRLALISALVEDRPICVFDEWAADQDPVFKDYFYREILADLKRRGKAVLVITHDDRYFEVGDRVLVLEDGELRGPREPTLQATSR